MAVGSLYVKRFFKEEAKKSALEMVDNIREEMYKILGKVDWMDDITRFVTYFLITMNHVNFLNKETKFNLVKQYLILIQFDFDLFYSYSKNKQCNKFK